jgi:MraZ protein
MGNIRFRGFYKHVLDDRKRLAIPSQFRIILNNESSGKLVLTPGYDHEIAVYALKTWEEVEQSEILTLSMDRVQSRRYRRHFTFGIKEDHLDNQGRILIPNFLMAHSGITKEAIIVGEIDYFTLWSPEQYEKFSKEIDRNYLDDSESIEDLRRR